MLKQLDEVRTAELHSYHQWLCSVLHSYHEQHEYINVTYTAIISSSAVYWLMNSKCLNKQMGSRSSI